MRTELRVGYVILIGIVLFAAASLIIASESQNQTYSPTEVITEWPALLGQEIAVRGRAVISTPDCVFRTCGLGNPCCMPCRAAMYLVDENQNSILLGSGEDLGLCVGTNCGLYCKPKLREGHTYTLHGVLQRSRGFVYLDLID